ncbi:MAG: Fic family protein [Candidatus Micrarchaeota archaeon]|nr:Fic family protein [Candidatus Micrarchaeota archaeon]
MGIEIRTVNEKKKYYLTRPYRLLGKVKNARIFLGTNLSKSALSKKISDVEFLLEKKVSELKSVGDPYKTVLSDSELDGLKTLESRGKIELVHLSEADWKKFVEVFTYNTNAIEGSTVTKGEVRKILEENKWPDRSKEEISETSGVSEAVSYIRKTKEHISLGLLKKLHHTVFKNSKGYAGKFRGRGVEVAVISSSGAVIHRGANSKKVVSLLIELVKWYSKNKAVYPPIVLAAVVHNQFEMIHPFQDGNGRVGRLLLNNILLKHGLPPVNIELKNQKVYYRALQVYEVVGDVRPMVELILKEYKSLKKMLK